MIGKLLWLIYKRVRAAFGLAFGLILMYGAYNHVLNYKLFWAASGLMLLHLFGDCYNDYWDYEEDARNKRKDKLTTGNFLTRKQLQIISFLILFSGLAILQSINGVLFSTGIAYSLLLWAYSHPYMRLKKYNLLGYALTESPWLLMPLILNSLFSIPLTASTLFFVLFYFSQYMYILCQKDSTDMNDTTNLFIKKGWKTASLYCIFFAIFSSYSLFLISTISLSLTFVWIFNLSIKLLNVSMIYFEKIERTARGRLVLADFITPYLFVFGGI